jgi:eukaryotic-like serine/threonine-protein kinase
LVNRGQPASSEGDAGTYLLGRYRVVDEIGIGGMASVHLARMDGPGGFQKWIAIKRIHSHLLEDESFVQMFLDEARIAARISHPNVATVFELGKQDETYWIAMEYLHGEPLREIIRRTDETGAPMPPEIACKVVADAAEGLHAAHELTGKNGENLNLIHRDVTPHNLFVTYDGVTKVVDFGIAKFSSRLSSSTRAGTLKGKLAYMSPEQVNGETIDRRTDIFALGVVLWELTTGRRLFRMDNDLDTLAKVQECLIPKPSSIVRGYPIDLEKIVLKALVKNRAERYRTAREFSRALQSFFLRRGLFIATDEVSTYLHGVFRERMAKRDAHLRWASDVTRTVNVDELVDGAPKTLPLPEAPAAALPVRPAAGAPPQVERIAGSPAFRNGPNSGVSGGGFGASPPTLQSSQDGVRPGASNVAVGQSRAGIQAGALGPSPRSAPGVVVAPRASMPSTVGAPSRLQVSPAQQGPRLSAPLSRSAISASASPAQVAAASSRGGGRVPQSAVIVAEGLHPADEDGPTLQADSDEPETLMGRVGRLPGALDGAIPPPDEDGDEQDHTIVESTSFDRPVDTNDSEPRTLALEGGYGSGKLQRDSSASSNLGPVPPQFPNPFHPGGVPLVTAAQPHMQAPHWVGTAVSQPSNASGSGNLVRVEPPSQPQRPQHTVPRMYAEAQTVTSQTYRRKRTAFLFIAGAAAFALLAGLGALGAVLFSGHVAPPSASAPARATGSVPTTESGSRSSAAGGTSALSMGPFAAARDAFRVALSASELAPGLSVASSGNAGLRAPPNPIAGASRTEGAPMVEQRELPTPPAVLNTTTMVGQVPGPPPRSTQAAVPAPLTPPASTPVSAPVPAQMSAQPVGSATLSVVCLPACSQVFDNGQMIGASPIFGRPVSAGPHSIRGVNGSKSKTAGTVRLRPDESQTVRISMPD